MTDWNRSRWSLLVLLWMGCAPSGAKNPDKGDTLSDEELDEQEGAQGEGDAEAPSWYADIKPLMESRCVGCHREGGVGTFSLEGYDAVQLVGSAIADAVESRRMPPWKAVDSCTDYRNDISLSPEEIDTVVNWIDGGMLVGDPDSARRGDPMKLGGLDRVDLTLELPVGYAPEGETDDYRCFPVQWPLDYSAYVTGYVVNPGRDDLVHHVIAYKAPASYGEAFLEKDALDEGPGYSCFGGPGVVDELNAAWLGGWSPGAVQGLLPNGIGIVMDPGSWVIIQVHYNLQAGAEGEDLTTIDVQIEEEVDTVGWIQPFASPIWVQGEGMNIPAETQDVTHEFSFILPSSFEFHTANLHMHKLGTEAKMNIVRSDGTEDCMLQIDDWDFDWQRSYVFDEAMIVNSGDEWTLECHWDNPTDADVAWGDGTGDEMCLGTTLMSYR